MVINPNECPVCNRVDPDGLEACADCYNGVWARAAQWEQRALKAEELLDAALAEVRRLQGLLYAEHRPAPEVS
jgi:hypothetical protein